MTAMRRIDLKSILERTVSGLYGDLVTRPTGQKVRGGIEAVLADVDGEIALIDFGQVRCLDISCADEIVGQLLHRAGRGRYFVLQGVTAAHCDAIEQVLERHGLAVVARDRDGRIEVLGPVAETARRAFHALSDGRPARAEEVAVQLALTPDDARRALEELCARGLVQQGVDGYVALTSA